MFYLLLLLLRATGTEHGMLRAFMTRALEINNNDAFKREHVESCPSTTKSIITSLPQCLWPSNLTAW